MPSLLRALAGAAQSYARLAWWGMALNESKPLVVAQAVILDPQRGVLLAVQASAHPSAVDIAMASISAPCVTRDNKSAHQLIQ